MEAPQYFRKRLGDSTDDWPMVNDAFGPEDWYQYGWRPLGSLDLWTDPSLRDCAEAKDATPGSAFFKAPPAAWFTLQAVLVGGIVGGLEVDGNPFNAFPVPAMAEQMPNPWAPGVVNTFIAPQRMPFAIQYCCRVYPGGKAPPTAYHLEGGLDRPHAGIIHGCRVDVFALSLDFPGDNIIDVGADEIEVIGTLKRAESGPEFPWRVEVPFMTTGVAFQTVMNIPGESRYLTVQSLDTGNNTVEFLDEGGLPIVRFQYNDRPLRSVSMPQRCSQIRITGSSGQISGIVTFTVNNNA